MGKTKLQSWDMEQQETGLPNKNLLFVSAHLKTKTNKTTRKKKKDLKQKLQSFILWKHVFLPGKFLIASNLVEHINSLCN